ncbi:phosphotransferase family protein [Paenibacillus monticola]|uniref:phosphotransferase family protein n=1 Tax=Paenibacillus monticola TaxID=2666075 RepID=UPI001E530F7D|nr:aminoglycoside phosphotransferase family protein [Paenibacillus monticola]
MSYESGVTLTTAIRKAKSLSERLQLIQSFGQFLNRFHEKYQMELSICEQGAWLTRQLSVVEEYVKDGLTSGSPQLLRHLELNRISPVQPTIIHGDCSTDNVLVLDGEVHMFIDVSGMTVGDPRYKISNEEIEYFENLYDFFNSILGITLSSSL